MPSKDEIEAWFDSVIDNKAIAQELKQLALVGLSVQERAKDAAEVAYTIMSTGASVIRSSPYEDVRLKMFNGRLPEMQELIAAFALKQKGEVLGEFDAEVEYQPVGMSKIIIPWENDLDQDLRYKTVHVTITAPKPLDVGEAESG